MQTTANAICVLSLLVAASGCMPFAVGARQKLPTDLQVPTCAARELSKVQLPSYRIEPPDIIDVEAVRLVPLPSYKLSTLDIVRVNVQRADLERIAPADVLLIRVPGAPAEAPINGNFIVQPNGTVNLGTGYSSMHVSGMTMDEAAAEIERRLATLLVTPGVTVSLSQAGAPVDGEFQIELDGVVDFGHPFGRISIAQHTLGEARELIAEHMQKFFGEPVVSINLVERSMQEQIIGEHLVAPDGTVSLGMYGSTSVVGMTVDEARAAIEAHLAAEFDQPRVSVTVFAYNSKAYYIITEGAGLGDNVFRFPVTGSETVLDAISQINGLPEVSSSYMWISRPTPTPGEYQVLPIDWKSVTSLAGTETNYQLLPGDRLYVAEDPLITIDTAVAKTISPIERIMGFSLLGAETLTRFSGKVLQGGGNPRGQGF